MPADDDECKHGMTKAYCADCRGLTLDTEPDWTIGHPFEAEFGGTCVRCRTEIDSGDMIGRVLDSGFYVHVACGKLHAMRGLR